MRTSRALLVAVAASVPALPAQVIQAPFNAIYTISTIGPIPGLPTNYGAITFARDDPNLLLCSKWNTVGVQNLYSIRVARDTQGHVTGFTGTVTPRAQADRIDGGLDFHPSGVLFYSRYPSGTITNAIGQFKPGSTVPDRVDSILGPNYIGGLAIVPAGLPGAGRLKTLRWPGGGWTDSILIPDTMGTFTIMGEAQTAVLSGGPDGFAYVPRVAPLFTGPSVMVAEFNTGNLAAYSVDAQGDPVPASRQVFASGLSGAFSLTVDPVTLDMLHADWSAGTIHLIKGFGTPCGQCSRYGTGLAGTGGLMPEITWLACALAGETTGVNIGKGLPNAPGALAIGLTQLSIPLFGGTLLNEASFVIAHVLNPAGLYTLTLQIPAGVAKVPVYFQGVYVDPGAVQGVSMSNGLTMPIQ